tara:strand:- start:47 stop:223 length:177 start_codon:yes stop_codon:yes gene_type:complete
MLFSLTANVGTIYALTRNFFLKYIIDLPNLVKNQDILVLKKRNELTFNTVCFKITFVD